MDPLQFYPTTTHLAAKAWGLFKNRDVVRALDPSAGDGALLMASRDYSIYKSRFEAIEIDGTKHDLLRARGITVVGLNFEEFVSTACYSHVIMNPPFARGCAHVLHAWTTLFDGEIVAILNAETVRNPFSKERKLLVSLIEAHGSVEFISDAFNGPDAVRTTDVEIALVYLRKKAESSEILGDLIKNLAADQHQESDVAAELPLMLPANHVENTVLAFNAAFEALRQEAYARARSTYYAAMLGGSISHRHSDQANMAPERSAFNARQFMIEGRSRLKDAAWSNILHSSQVRDRLSSGALKRLESEFETITKLEFTTSNVYGFLAGICNSGWELQLEMACEVFDLATKYHEENTVHFMGWKSNSRHRECGMRLRTNRFVLPNHQTTPYATSLSFASTAVLKDIDHVFAMLDGKLQAETSMVEIFERHFDDLRNGVRVSSSYFDCRYFPKGGTIHFFPRDKTLVDRLNRIVGQHRQWLPPATEQASKGFWAQYDKAETFDATVRKEFEAAAKAMKKNAISPNDAHRPEYCDSGCAHEILSQVLSKKLHTEGIDIDFQIDQRNILSLESA